MLSRQMPTLTGAYTRLEPGVMLKPKSRKGRKVGWCVPARTRNRALRPYLCALVVQMESISGLYPEDFGSYPNGGSKNRISLSLVLALLLL